MKSTSVAGPASAALLALVAAVLLLLPWRLFECRLCGAGFRKRQLASTANYDVAPTACMACRDHGRVGLVSRLKQPAPDPRLLDLLRVPSGPRVPMPVGSLQSLLQAAGATPRYAAPANLVWGHARLAVCDGQEVVLVLAGEPMRWVFESNDLKPAAGRFSSQVWMFDLRGRLLDSRAVEGSQPCVAPGWTLPRGSEDAPLVLEILDAVEMSKEVISRRGPARARSLDGVRAWALHEGDVDPARWVRDGEGRFRIAGGRFVPGAP